MKKLTVIFILLASLFLLAPPLVGMQAHSQLERSILRAGSQSGASIDISLEDYERNWFSMNSRICTK